jgi:hypothetical protein
MADLVRGRDFSGWNGAYDWASLDPSAVFVMCRLFEWRAAGGSSWPWGIDNQLERNVRLGAQHGRVLGGYHRVDPTRWTAAVEARRMVGLLDLCGLLSPGRMRPAVDIELTDDVAGNKRVDWPRWTREFFAAWRELTVMPLRVYASGSAYNDLLGGVTDWPAWVDCWVGHTNVWSTPTRNRPAEEWAGQTGYTLGGRAVLHQYAKTPADFDCFMPGKTWADAVLRAA